MINKKNASVHLLTTYVSSYMLHGCFKKLKNWNKEYNNSWTGSVFHVVTAEDYKPYNLNLTIRPENVVYLFKTRHLVKGLL